MLVALIVSVVTLLLTSVCILAEFVSKLRVETRFAWTLMAETLLRVALPP